MKVLGISALYHDSAAALVSEQKIIAAAQEERFTRKKHDLRIPKHAIEYCLAEGKIKAEELDAVVYYDNPIVTADRIMKNCVALKKESQTILKKSYESLFSSKIWIHKLLQRELGQLGKTGQLLCLNHHVSHAASAFYPSPFESAAILTVDGVGEWATTTIGFGEKNKIKLLKEIDYPHSLGLLYSAFTYFCGFKVNSGEYKLMGLAPYGEPIYYDKIRDNLIDIREDGSYRLNLDYFAYWHDLVMTNDKFENLFGGKKRESEADVTKREMDMAASVQKVTEELMIRLATQAKYLTGAKYLTLAGGVALNCVANGKILKEKIFSDLWIQPAAGDAGGALGAGLYVVHHHFEQSRKNDSKGKDLQAGSYLGPQYDEHKVKKFLDENKYSYIQIQDEEKCCERIAKEIASGKIVGHFSGRMEFGPRALGARSILADPRSPEMQSKLNLKIKFRESFRPFAPAVLAEDVNKYFELDCESPYMLIVAPVKNELRVNFDLKESFAEHGTNMLPIVNQKRSSISSVTHVDYSARVQTINKNDHERFYRLIEAFKKETGCSVLINTSFNVRGEPIVCSPQDAYRCFMRTDMDILVLENCILYKENQPEFIDDKAWRDEYELD